MSQRTRAPCIITSLLLTSYMLSMLLAARKIITESMWLKITWVILRDNSSEIWFTTQMSRKISSLF